MKAKDLKAKFAAMDGVESVTVDPIDGGFAIRVLMGTINFLKFSRVIDSEFALEAEHPNLRFQFSVWGRLETAPGRAVQ